MVQMSRNSALSVSVFLHFRSGHMTCLHESKALRSDLLLYETKSFGKCKQIKVCYYCIQRLLPHQLSP